MEYDSTHTLSNNTIRCLVEDHLGRIWIGTNDGLNYYDPVTELIYPVTIVPSQNRSIVWTIHIENDFLLVGTNNGLWKTSIKSNSLQDIEDQFYKVNNFNNDSNSN